MDENVIAAMARWPNVPDVYGWLSLTGNGLWRLHPQGDAWQPYNSESPGESISSPQIIGFIGRNYNCDAAGRWFFQNGPQKVYVRLDAAPYILHTASNTSGDTAGLNTHTGLEVLAVHEWWLDDLGRLYALTEHGPGLIAGRDLATVTDALHTTEGPSLMDMLDADPDWTQGLSLRALNAPRAATTPAVPLRMCRAADIPTRLRFVRNPHPEK